LKQIYVVDNDPGMCKLLAMAFAQAGHEIVACGAPEAVQEALQNGECAALLMDYHLGAGESGAGLVRGWATRFEMPPTWIVTGTPDAADLTDVSEVQGVMGVVAKPLAIIDLVAMVTDAVQPAAPEMEAEA